MSSHLHTNRPTGECDSQRLRACVCVCVGGGGGKHKSGGHHQPRRSSARWVDRSESRKRTHRDRKISYLKAGKSESSRGRTARAVWYPLSASCRYPKYMWQSASRLWIWNWNQRISKSPVVERKDDHKETKQTHARSKNDKEST
mgnify:CR=1 FL=1